ncbi:type II secretion system F family protein [Seongchinamella unica]|uniref:Type II secretion system F family protein n=1 Tax=Seongchinamella unica TaxID=2547392 RepID=A0A4R5LV25_9GAMM|nr:type II secretion system F family protein [Seongchinamella unica]TDG15232.1 type II secretion system F family protein [Seongchinamella unica]
MAVFSYQAVTPQGETRSGTITASSEQEAVARIQTMGLMVMNVASGPAAGAANESRLGFATRKSLKHADIVDLTRQLAVLIGAGLPLDRALEIIHSVSRLPPLVELVTRIQEAVRGGDALSKALAEFPEHFSDFYINFVRSAEYSGDMAASLQDLSDHLEKAQALKEQLKSALVYPVILVMVTAASLAVIFIYVLPEFAEMFADMDADLPASTAFILGTAEFFSQYAWLFFALLIALLLYIRSKSQDEAWRLGWDTRVLSLPLVGDLVAKVEMARLSRSLGTLLRGGVPLLTALGIARESLQNRLLAQRLAEATASLQEGAGLAEPLMATGVFPEFALQMIQVGEETGKLDQMLLKVADIYDAEVATATQRMLSVLEPVMILGLAVVIGGIVISILSAIMGINQMPV